jgi:phosphoglycolate phosphatase
VIVDSLDVIWECFDKINKKHNFFPFKNKNELTTIWDKNLFESVKELGINIFKLRKFYKEWVDLLVENNERVKMFHGLKPILEKLSRDNHLTIVSSNDHEVITNFLKRNDIFDYFQLILGTESGRSKKKKLKLVLNKFEIQEDMIYFITDTIGDLKELKDSGIKMVAVTWGYHDKNKLRKEKPDFLIESPKKLLDLFL